MCITSPCAGKRFSLVCGFGVYKSSSSRQILNARLSLYFLNSIDETSLEMILGYNLKANERYLLDKCLSALPHHISEYVSITWRYCPTCISKGYHSTLHQILFFDRCFLHGDKLESECPSCGLDRTYIIEPSYEEPFRCECGFSYLASEKDDFNSRINIVFKNELINKWFKLENVQFFFPKAFKNEKLLDQIFNALENSKIY